MLGLPLEMALAAYQREGREAPHVAWTAAPPRRGQAEAPAQGEARVVALRDEGRTLVCARFLTGAPKTKETGNTDADTARA